MSPFSEKEMDRSVGALEAERTLRLIASLPAPAGIEERVKSGLRAAPKRTAVLAWPADGRRWMRSAGMRMAAAAAIVLMIAGGGWGVYSHIQVAPVASAAPSALPDGGGFNAAGAKRTPKTVDGPVVAAPVIGQEKSSVTQLGTTADKKAKHPQVGTKAVPKEAVR